MKLQPGWLAIELDAASAAIKAYPKWHFMRVNIAEHIRKDRARKRAERKVDARSQQES